ncbi:MAG: hypothetical protein A4E53_01937 [Pelotomaculum sp. PtaB.Bin104]|nr:MAG: hypothetical protein A4E53_01937 [Pelotomaculum sp. PtaB.Bin104]
MKHWFVSWLEECAEKSLIEAEEYRKALESNTPEAKNLIKAFEGKTMEILEAADRSEQYAKRFIEWAQLAEDMISLGFEEFALSYFDAKQALEPCLLPPRPNKAARWILDDIAEILELKIAQLNGTKELEQIKDIYITIVELYSTGMHEIALTYYLRKIHQNTELKLPEPEVSSD